MKEIQLTKGCVALVDDEDYDFISQWKWCVSNAVYAVRRGSKIDGDLRGTIILMHRVIMHTPEGMSVDHIDGNSLNNCRSNLRNSTHSQNMFNKKLRSDSSSGIKGVQKHGNKWRVHIGYNGLRVRVGSYNSIDEAVAAYNQAALKYHGEYARLSEAIQ